jgi:hypothetical protein
LPSVLSSHSPPLSLSTPIPTSASTPSISSAPSAAFMQLGVPEFADVCSGDGEEVLRINTNNSSSTMKDGRWTRASIISIRNISQGGEDMTVSSTVITVYTGMESNGFQLRLVELDADGQVDEESTSAKNTHWCKGGGEGGGSTLDIPLRAQEECFLHIAYIGDPSSAGKLTTGQHGRTNSADLSHVNSTHSFSIFAEDHFMVYSRHKISEKTRIPVRLLLPITTPTPVVATLPALPKVVEQDESLPNSYIDSCDEQLPNLALDLDQKSFNLPLITNVSPTTEIPLSFAGLEGTIASFLKTFSLYWSKVFAQYVSLPTASLQPLRASSLTSLLRTSSAAAAATYEQRKQDALVTNASSLSAPDGHDLCNDLHITEQEPQQTMANFFSELRQFVTVTDNSIYEHQHSDSRHSPLGQLAHEMAELYIHFVAITDMLVLHTMRQSYHGHEWMTSAHSAIPVAKLSLLVFSMVFKHPVFLYYCLNNGENQKDEATLFPPPLIPFARTLLYYMSFFPDTPLEMEPLNQLCQTVRRCLQIKI